MWTNLAHCCLDLENTQRISGNFETLLCKAIKDNTADKHQSKPWCKLKILAPEVEDFSRAISSLKSTVLVAIGAETLGRSKVSLEAVQGFTEFVSTTIPDMQATPGRISENLDQLQIYPEDDYSRKKDHIQSCLQDSEDCLGYVTLVNEKINSISTELKTSAAQSTEHRLPFNVLGPHAPEELLERALNRISAELNSACLDVRALQQRLLSLCPNANSSAKGILCTEGPRPKLGYSNATLEYLIHFCPIQSDAEERARAKGNVVNNMNAEEHCQQAFISTTAELFNLTNVHSGRSVIQAVWDTSSLNFFAQPRRVVKT